MTALTKTTLIDFMLGEFTVVESNKSKKLVVLFSFSKGRKNCTKSNADYTFRTIHGYYFSKNEDLEFSKKKSSKSIIDPRCAVYGIRLIQYRAELRYQTMEIPVLRMVNK